MESLDIREARLFKMAFNRIDLLFDDPQSLINIGKMFLGQKL